MEKHPRYRTALLTFKPAYFRRKRAVPASKNTILPFKGVPWALYDTGQRTSDHRQRRVDGDGLLHPGLGMPYHCGLLIRTLLSWWDMEIFSARPKRGDGLQERQVAGVDRAGGGDELIRVHHYQETFLFPFFLFERV